MLPHHILAYHLWPCQPCLFICQSCRARACSVLPCLVLPCLALPCPSWPLVTCCAFLACPPLTLPCLSCSALVCLALPYCDLTFTNWPASCPVPCPAPCPRACHVLSPDPCPVLILFLIQPTLLCPVWPFAQSITIFFVQIICVCPLRCCSAQGGIAHHVMTTSHACRRKKHKA